MAGAGIPALLWHWLAEGLQVSCECLHCIDWAPHLRNRQRNKLCTRLHYLFLPTTNVYSTPSTEVVKGDSFPDLTNEVRAVWFICTKHHESLRRRNNAQHYSFLIVRNCVCVWITRDVRVCCAMRSSEAMGCFPFALQKEAHCATAQTLPRPQPHLPLFTAMLRGQRYIKSDGWTLSCLPSAPPAPTEKSTRGIHLSLHTTFLLGLCAARMAAKLVYFRGQFSYEASYPCQVSATGLSCDNQPS